jgi:hypothetical protein
MSANHVDLGATYEEDDEDALPPGWERVASRRTGEYFLHTDSGRTTKAAPAWPAASSAREEMFVPVDFYDVISGDVMADPVMASDGHSYSRDSITQWIQTCRRERRRPISPLTREELASDSLRPNITLKKPIVDYPKEQANRASLAQAPALYRSMLPADGTTATAVTTDTSIMTLNELGRVYAHLDPLRKLLAETLDGWQPPQLVAVGIAMGQMSVILLHAARFH